MNFLNEDQSVAFFKYVRASLVRSTLTFFGSKLLIWLMLVLIVVYYQSIYWLPFVLLPWGVTLLISTFVKRPRPYQKRTFKPLMMPTIKTYSFPSEHATVAFAIAGAFYIAAPIHFIPMLVAALLVSLARVGSGIHYFSDVITGAFIGFLLSVASQMVIVLIAFAL